MKRFIFKVTRHHNSKLPKVSYSTCVFDNYPAAVHEVLHRESLSDNPFFDRLTVEFMGYEKEDR